MSAAEEAGASTSEENGGLELFLRTKARDAEAEIVEIQKLIDEVLDTFLRAFLEDDHTWPYMLVNGKSRRPGYSFSTIAMITFALSLATERIEHSVLVPTVVWSPPAVAERLAKERKYRWDAVNAMVIQAVDQLIRKSQKSQRLKGALSTSGTYGKDDPFTLTWLLEVLKGLKGEDVPAPWSPFREAFKEEAWKRVQKALHGRAPGKGVLRIGADVIVPHSFPTLRMLQLGQACLGDDAEHLSRHADLSKVRESLYQRVHMQLSESQIAAGGFDAADLMFALEGWILTSPEDPPLGLVARAFEVLEDSQKRTPYWRPLRPFKVSTQGLVLLPQSVEIANSILRICNAPLLDREGYLSSHVELLRNYTQWLLGRIYRGSFTGAADGRFVGWESEHTYALDRIHLWQTSQALIFLQHYIRMLQQHYIARRSLELAGFVWQRDQTVRVPLKQRGDDWREWVANEPLEGTTEERRYLVYEQIDREFVQLELGSPGSGSHALLLYGPPGTGKSTMAEKIAEALDFPLITITPSDFIAGGVEAIEARAKAIFEMLGVQTNLVVLFDEIDNLLLDRDSILYREQGDVFKLLTPGMLTKLGDLAKKKTVLFVIATNYFERIDPAIKRPGRIDARCLVLPPNLKQRKQFLGQRLKERWEGILEHQDEIARRTYHFTYRELIDLARHVNAQHKTEQGDELAQVLRNTVDERPALIALENYRLRLDLRKVDEQLKDKEPVTREFPWEEFALLAYLELEATETIPEKPEWIREAVKLALEEEEVRDDELAAALQTACG